MFKFKTNDTMKIGARLETYVERTNCTEMDYHLQAKGLLIK